MYISQLYAGRNINSKTIQEIEKTVLTLHGNETNGDFSCYRHSKYHILYFVNSEKNAEMDNSSYAIVNSSHNSYKVCKTNYRLSYV